MLQQMLLQIRDLPKVSASIFLSAPELAFLLFCQSFPALAVD